MDRQNNRYPILVDAQKYVTEYRSKGGGGPKKPPFSLEEIQKRLTPQVNNTIQALNNLPEKFKVESHLVSAIQVFPDFLAKTYFPWELFYNCNFTYLGTRRVDVPLEERRRTKNTPESQSDEESKILFIAGPRDSYDRFLAQLKEPERKFVDDIRKFGFFFELESDRKNKAFGFQNDAKYEGYAEVVLHGFPGESRRKEFDKFKMLCKAFQLHCIDEQITKYTEERAPIFCPVEGAGNDLVKLAGFNPLRAIRPMPRISLKKYFSLSVSGTPLPALPAPLPDAHLPSKVVASFDGGVDISHPALGNYVSQEDLTTKPDDQESLEHGTAVVSTLLYGSIDPEWDRLPYPSIGVHNFRAFPPPASADIGGGSPEYWFIDHLERIVEQRDFKFYNLSFNHSSPIGDHDPEVHRLTFALDRLAKDHGVIFYSSAGNDGNQDPLSGLGRIQPPSDAVNGVAVGSVVPRDGSKGAYQYKRCSYSCYGPGPVGAPVKPDLVAPGGAVSLPVLVCAANHHAIIGHICGTSFAVPNIARIGAESWISQDAPNLKPLAVRALQIHTAKELRCGRNKLGMDEVGYGLGASSADDLLRCGKSDVVTIFQGELNLKEYRLFPILLPSNLSASLGNEEKVFIKVTFLYLPHVDASSPNEYILEDLSVKFCPDEKRHDYSLPNDDSAKAIKNLHEILNKDEIEDLVQKGYQPSALPAGKSFATKNAHASLVKSNEQKLRQQGKWTVIRTASFQPKADQLDKPAIGLHFSSRYSDKSHITIDGAIEYVCVVQMSVKQDVDLYNSIRSDFPLLTQVRIRQRIR